MFIAKLTNSFIAAGTLSVLAIGVSTSTSLLDFSAAAGEANAAEVRPSFENPVADIDAGYVTSYAIVGEEDQSLASVERSKLHPAMR